MPRLPVRARKKRKKRPLPWRERLRRTWIILIEGWWFWLSLAAYAGLMLYVAINPLVDPLMPDRGKYKILGVYPASFALLDGDAGDGIQFILLWLPIAYFLIRFPFWLKGQREWERKAILRRAREKAKRAQRRREREAAEAGLPGDETNARSAREDTTNSAIAKHSQ